MAKPPFSIALAGLGGYGHVYLKGLLGTEPAQPTCNFRFVAGIDPTPSRCPQLEHIQRRQVPIFSSLEQFYQSGGHADLMVVCTPLHLHAEHTALALRNGSHVLCEKPLGAHPDQAQQMMSVREQTKRQVAIGYQWSYSSAIQALKRDVMSGRWGRPLRLRTKVYWPRDRQYYTRSNWAGKIKDPQGRLVLDSPANNACAHYLHNMFYVLGSAVDRSAAPARVEAELYRANEIENYDTAVIRCRASASSLLHGNGPELLLVVSHATYDACQPIFAYEFERATIHHGGEYGESVVAVGHDGTTRHDYGVPTMSDSPQKLWVVASALCNNTLVACGPEAAASQTACIFAAQEAATIKDVPSELIRTIDDGDSSRRWVVGLRELLDDCYDRFLLPSETGGGGARPARSLAVA